MDIWTSRLTCRLPAINYCLKFVKIAYIGNNLPKQATVDSLQQRLGEARGLLLSHNEAMLAGLMAKMKQPISICSELTVEVLKYE